MMGLFFIFVLWQAEVNFLGDLVHPNLVKLIAYCIEDDQRPLVYEFMPRSSLENHLFRRMSKFLPPIHLPNSATHTRMSCWLQHMFLDNETGLDPPGIRVRPVSGLVAADYFAPGYFVWAILIANLACVAYEEKNMYMAAYDWRDSFQNTAVSDQTLSRIKNNIQLMGEINGGQKAVIIPHSMGVLYFFHFMKWVEAPALMGGGGGPDWCAKHIEAVMNIGGPLLGAPKALSGLFSAEAKDVAFARGIAPGVLDSDVFYIQTLPFLKAVDHCLFYKIHAFSRCLGAVKGNNVANSTCHDVWTEYDDMGFGGIKAGLIQPEIEILVKICNLILL